MKKKITDLLDVDQLIQILDHAGVKDSRQVVLALAKQMESQLDLKIKQIKNQGRIASNDAKKESSKALDVLTESQINSLPRWVRGVLADSFVIGSSGQVVQTPNGKKYHLANPLNDLPGGEWTYFLNSVMSTRYPTSGPESYAHHIRKVHPSPKPPQLMREIIEFFTKENELVLDFFMGVGGTLLGASLANRRAIGIDLSKEFIEVYGKASLELGLPIQKTIVANSLDLIPNEVKMKSLLEDEEVSLIAIDPPYGDMMSRSKTGESAKMGKNTESTPFTESDQDLGNLPLENFYSVFRGLVKSSIKYLKHKGHLVVFIKDLQPTKDSTNLLHARVIDDLHSIEGLNYLGTKIWADNSVNLYPYGYPYSFVSNQIHQYIMIFRKS